MHISDSHFHWWPTSVLEQFCKRKDFRRAERNARGGYSYRRGAGRGQPVNSWAEWFDLDKQLEHMDRLGHQVDVVCSLGPLSVAFSDLAPDLGPDVCTTANAEMAGAPPTQP